MKSRFLVASAALSLLAFGACSKNKSTSEPTTPEDSAVAAAEPETPAEPVEPTGPRAADGSEFVAVADLPPGQWYRAALNFERLGELPFYLFLPEAAGESGYLKNGAEMVPVKWSAEGKRIEIIAPWNYPSRLVAKRTKNGGMRGKFEREFPLWGHVENPFSAEPVEAPDPKARFTAATQAPPPKIDMSGTWRFEFKHHGEGKGHFAQDENGVVTGFVRPGSFGDLRFMAGNVFDQKLRLSQFNGNSVNLIVADVKDGGKTMSGTMSMYNIWNEPFTAKKMEGWEYESQVYLEKGKNKVTIPALNEFAGKPVIESQYGKKPQVVFIFATWCPVCNDAAPYFVKLHEQYGDKVRFLSLAYDLSEDEKANAEQLAKFRKKYGIDWEVMQVPTTPENWAADMPQEIKGWEGFPVSIFLNRDGTVHAVYGGWFGPATGEENVHIKAQFATWIEEISKT